MAEPDTPTTIPTKISFDYIKTSQFRIVHVDGAFGGPTPQGHLFISFYAERPPIPQRVVHEVMTTTDGVALGPEIPTERNVRPGVVRDVEVGVIMTLQNAIALRDLLNSRIELLEKK